jgi:hypothetical protein
MSAGPGRLPSGPVGGAGGLALTYGIGHLFGTAVG